eukprot:TRINITY_DN6769_c0_g1_i5.p2 TRINITY_DN6769_c0_g1~~TRINITY_DN6769_c0_g1_i5.p2  ORF type:complete len:102 (-),score=16.72 TRINITY_DN6769_c0_g1_i5:61-366(-)
MCIRDSILFDFVNLQKASDDLFNEIYNELKADPKLLTPFTSIQLLQACASQVQHQRMFLLAHLIQRNIGQFINEMELDQATQIFKHLAKIHLEQNLSLIHI